MNIFTTLVTYLGLGHVKPEMLLRQVVELKLKLFLFSALFLVLINGSHFSDDLLFLLVELCVIIEE